MKVENEMKKASLSVIALLMIQVCLAQTQTQSQTQHHEQTPEDIFKVLKLSDSVYALYGRGGNIGFFVGPEAVVVVDSQFHDLAPGIFDQIKKVTDKPVKYLINTHHHQDHVGGNDYFIKFAVIIAHDNVRKRMLMSPQQILKEYPAELEKARKENNQQSIEFLEEQIEWAKKVKVEEIAAPFFTYDSEFRIYMGGETIHVWHTPPAHTDGDSVVYFEKANVLHMGDLGWNKVIPFIDVEGGGSPNGYLLAFEKIKARVPSDVKIIPGHGEVMTVKEFEIFRQYIQEVIDAATKARFAGKPKEVFVQEFDLPAYSEWRGYKDRFKENAASAYDEASPSQ
jgi:cyclase